MGGTESTGRLNGTETEEEERRRRRESGGGAAAIAIATAVAAWGISRMLSDTKEKDEARMITTHEGANRSRHVNQTQTLYFGSGSTTTPEAIIWFPPPPNRYKMNTDGGFRPFEIGQPSVYAGILRNHRCECIQTFRGFSFGLTGSLEAEIFGILKGLVFLVDNGLKGAILENDCDQAVLWINGENKSYDIPKEKMAHCKEMIDKCRMLAVKNNIAIHNIDRNANKCADELGRLALKERNQYVQNDLPDSVKRLVDQDKAAYHRNLSLK